MCPERHPFAVESPRSRRKPLAPHPHAVQSAPHLVTHTVVEDDPRVKSHHGSPMRRHVSYISFGVSSHDRCSTKSRLQNGGGERTVRTRIERGAHCETRKERARTCVVAYVVVWVHESDVDRIKHVAVPVAP